MFYLSNRFYYLCGGVITLYCIGNIWSILDRLYLWAIWFCIFAFLVDLIILYASCQGKMQIKRMIPQRLSCGVDNKLKILLESPYGIKLDCNIIEELPPQLHIRNFILSATLKNDGWTEVIYNIIPPVRGDMVFGYTNVFVFTPFHIIERRFVRKENDNTKVYPAFNFIVGAQLMSPQNRDIITGQTILHRKGYSSEFDTLREYTQGDSYRMINWNATARRNQLMVNQHIDETRQNIIAIIDKGRSMQHTFDGITLLDHSINATLRLLYTAVSQHDNAGLITFDKKIDSFVSAESVCNHNITRFMEILYKESTTYQESDFSLLMAHCQRYVKRRSLIMLFTQFDSMIVMRRQLPFLRNLAKKHALVVVFYEDQDMRSLAEQPHITNNDYVTSMLAYNMMYEKRLIVNELRRNGVASLLVTPEHLTASVINKYIEMKKRRAI